MEEQSTFTKIAVLTAIGLIFVLGLHGIGMALCSALFH